MTRTLGTVSAKLGNSFSLSRVPGTSRVQSSPRDVHFTYIVKRLSKVRLCCGGNAHRSTTDNDESLLTSAHDGDTKLLLGLFTTALERSAKGEKRDCDEGDDQPLFKLRFPSVDLEPFLRSSSPVTGPFLRRGAAEHAAIALSLGGEGGRHQRNCALGDSFQSTQLEGGGCAEDRARDKDAGSSAGCPVETPREPEIF